MGIRAAFPALGRRVGSFPTTRTQGEGATPGIIPVVHSQPHATGRRGTLATERLRQRPKSNKCATGAGSSHGDQL